MILIKKIKRFISMLLCIIMTFAVLITSFAKSNESYKMNNIKNSNITKKIHKDKKNASKVLEDEIMSNSKVPLKKISMNPYNKKEIESVISKYKLQPETVESIYEYINRCENGEISSGEICVYLPENVQMENSSGEFTTSGIDTYTKTYRGYGNKLYYEEVLQISQASSMVTVKEDDGWASYFNSTIDAVAKLVINGVLDYFSSGWWSVASIFTKGIPSSVPPNTDFRHEARLREYKVKKFTYLYQNGQYYFGSRVELSISYFENDIVFPGLTPTIHGEDTDMEAVITPSYDIPDKKAYYYYINGGYVEDIYDYKYGGVSFRSY